MQMRNIRLAVLPMLVMLGLLATGFAYAHWSQTLYIEGSVATGSPDWEFTWTSSTDPGPPNFVLDDHCSDNFKDRWTGDKDVGYTTAKINEENNHIVEVTLNNVYPSYCVTVAVYAHNCGTIPLKIEKVIIDENEITTTSKVRLDLNSDELFDIEIWWRDGFGVQTEPCEDFPEISFWIHILQDAPQSATLNFTIEIVAVQCLE